MYIADMRALGFNIGSCSLVIALAIAIASIGFAHRTVPAAITPELATFVAAGGNLGDLCGTLDGEGAPVSSDCEACRITDTYVYVRPTCVDLTEAKKVRVFAFVAKRIAERNDLDPARLTRAPPQA